MPTAYPPLNHPPIDKATGLFTRPWQAYFSQLQSTIGPGAAPVDAEYVLGLADAVLPNGRIPTNTTTVTWDLATANQIKANVVNPADMPIHWAYSAGITNAQFKALPTTYQTIVAAPGAGKTLVPWWAYIQVNAGTPYTNVDPSTLSGLTIAYGDWAEDCFTFTLNFSGSTYRQMLMPAQAVPDAAALLFPAYPPKSYVLLGENQPFKLVAWNDLGDYTGGAGGNSVVVGVAYSILTIQTGVFS